MQVCKTKIRSFPLFQNQDCPFFSSICFSGVCVQVSLQIHSQVVKVKSSCVVKGESDPYFSHRMAFKLRSQHLEEACLRLELQQPGDSRSGGKASEQLIQSWCPTNVALSTISFFLSFVLLPDPPTILGALVLGPFMYARGPQLQHWMDMVSTPQEPLQRWHKLNRAT